MVVGRIELDYIKYGFRLIVFLTIMLFYLKRKHEMFTLFKIIVLATVVGSGYDLFNYISSGSYQRSLPFGVDSKFLIQIYAGGIFSITAIISAHLAVMGRSRIEKILYSLSCVYLSTLVYLSQSRAAILCYLLSIVIYILLSKRVKVKHGLITLLTFSLIFIFINNHIYKFTSLLARKDSGRLEIWALSLDILKDKALFGHGLGADFLLKTSVGSFTEPHNLYLYAIFTGGMVCLLLLLILYWMAIKAVFHNWCPDLGPFMAAILLFIITFNFFDSRMIVDDIGVGWHLFWFPIGLIAAFASLQGPVKDEVSIDNPCNMKGS
jgi:O-antigen ligase